MTDSTAGNNASDGALEVGASADELFGELEDSFEGEPSHHESDDASTGEGPIEDQTAADVFAKLRSDVRDDTDEVLSDESPENIIASADDPDPEPEVDDGLLVDEDALEDLLLTGRTKEQEFLWVDADDDEEPSDTTETAAADSNAIGTSDADTTETAADDKSTASDVDEPTATPFAGDVDVERAGADEAGGADTLNDGESSTGSRLTAIDKPSHTAEPIGDATPDSDRETETISERTESDETALAVKDEEQSLATTDDSSSSSGILAWLRSKFGSLL